MVWGILTAAATPLVVTDPADVEAVATALEDYWPDGDIEILLYRSEVIPRFELSAGTLFWVTPEGTHQRPTPSADTAILLAKSWVVTRVPEDLGWIPPAPPVLETPPERPPTKPQAPRRPPGPPPTFRFGVGVRAGSPIREALPSVVLHTGLQHKRALVELEWALGVGSLRNPETRERLYKVQSILYDPRHGVALRAGVAAPEFDIGTVGKLLPLGLVGVEAQRYSTYLRFTPGDPSSAAFTRWDAGAQALTGLELRQRDFAWRVLAGMDTRERRGFRPTFVSSATFIVTP